MSRSASICTAAPAALSTSDDALDFLFMRYAKPATLEGTVSYAIFLRICDDTSLLDRLTQREAATCLADVRPRSNERIKAEDFRLIVRLIATQSERRANPDVAYQELAARMLKAFVGKYPHKLPPNLVIPRLTDNRPTVVSSLHALTRQIRSDSRPTTPAKATNAARSTLSAPQTSIVRRAVPHAQSNAYESLSAVQREVHPQSKFAFLDETSSAVDAVDFLRLPDNAYRPRGLSVLADHCRTFLAAHSSAELCGAMGVSTALAPLFEADVIDTDIGLWNSVRRCAKLVFPVAGCQVVAEELTFQHIFDGAMSVDIQSDDYTTTR
jgi:hypothetical protein